MAKTKKGKKQVEVVVFEDPLKKRHKNYVEKTQRLEAKAISDQADQESKRPIFNQKRAKYDIRKLAITGMNKSEKAVAMVDFLVELGAKRPKEKHVSIKEYMEQNKKRKLEGGGENERKALIEEDEKLKKSKTKTRRDKDDILDSLDGQIGSYERGVQMIKGGKWNNKKKKRK